MGTLIRIGRVAAWLAALSLSLGGCFQSVVTGPGSAPSDPAPSDPDLGPADLALLRDEGPDVGADEGVVETTDRPFLLDLDGAPSPRPGSNDGDRNSVTFLVWNECMRADVGTVRLQPGDLELRVDSPDTTTFDAVDFGEGFIDDVVGRDEFDADPGRYRNIGFRLVPPVLLTAGTEYTLTVEDDWRDCDDDNPPTDEVPGSVPLTYSFRLAPPP
ncbi:MAG: hypothetical protein AAF447_20385 [Myxococcota bacterium]